MIVSIKAHTCWNTGSILKIVEATRKLSRKPGTADADKGSREFTTKLSAHLVRCGFLPNVSFVFSKGLPPPSALNKSWHASWGFLGAIKTERPTEDTRT